MEVPNTWKPIKSKGVDSYFGLIAIDEKDTLTFDLGWYSNNLNEEKNFFVENGRVQVLDESKSKGNSEVYKFVGLVNTVDTNRFKKNKISFQKIDDKKAKIVQPIISGKGTTGVYFDSLWRVGDAIDKFQMNGHNLKVVNERDFLTALKTLKFVQKK